MIAKLDNVPLIYIPEHGTTVFPKQVAQTGDFSLEPFLFKLPERWEKYDKLWKHIKLSYEFSSEQLVDVLPQLRQERLTRSEIDQVKRVLEQLVSDVPYNKQIPDELKPKLILPTIDNDMVGASSCSIMYLNS